jgi:type II secretory pathway pseudopilin PulG
MTRHPQQGFTLVEVLIAGAIGAITVAGIGSAMVAMARAQARLTVGQAASDQLQLARAALIGSAAPPVVSGAVISSPTVVINDGCALAVIDATHAPYALQLEATCDRGQTATLRGWATWTPPTPPTP